VVAKIAVPPSETSFTKYFPQIPRDTEVIYHVMVGPAVLTFVKELGEFFGPSRPEIFGFIDSLEAVDIASPGLEFLEGTYFWEGMPRYAQENQSSHDKLYREAVGVDANGASTSDAKDVATFAHMFGLAWKQLTIKALVIVRSLSRQLKTCLIWLSLMTIRKVRRSLTVKRTRPLATNTFPKLRMANWLWLIQRLGAVIAAVLAMTAMGLSIVFGVMRVVNVAHGEFFMLGAQLLPGG